MPTLRTRPFPTRFAILPSSQYLFEHSRDATEINMRIVAEATLANGLEVLACNLGFLAFDFANTPLGPFNLVEQIEYGSIDPAVTDSKQDLIQLQASRMQMAVFVAACIFGRHGSMSHSTLRGPQYPDLGQIYVWSRDRTDRLLLMPQDEFDRVAPFLQERIAAVRKSPRSTPSIPAAHFLEGISLADRLMAAPTRDIDYRALIVMNYQAAILHQRQHAGASIALSAVVVEAALKELLDVYGLVTGTTARAHAIKPHSCAQISRRHAKDLGFEKLVTYLSGGKLIDNYLAERIGDVRQARNLLMHKGADAMPGQSGMGLTVVRDVLALLTGEQFELNTSWSYRT